MTRARLRGLLDRLETLAANRALCLGLPECSDRGRHSDELGAARKAVLDLLASPAAAQPREPPPENLLARKLAEAAAAQPQGEEARDDDDGGVSYEDIRAYFDDDGLFRAPHETARKFLAAAREAGRREGRAEALLCDSCGKPLATICDSEECVNGALRALASPSGPPATRAEEAPAPAPEEGT